MFRNVRSSSGEVRIGLALAVWGRVGFGSGIVLSSSVRSSNGNVL
jgi:hypothetical protein